MCKNMDIKNYFCTYISTITPVDLSLDILVDAASVDQLLCRDLNRDEAIFQDSKFDFLVGGGGTMTHTNLRPTSKTYLELQKYLIASL